MSHQTTVNEILLRAQVKELASEFRRLAAEARTCIDDTHPWEAEPASRAWAERAETWDEAAKMLGGEVEWKRLKR